MSTVFFALTNPINNWKGDHPLKSKNLNEKPVVISIIFYIINMLSQYPLEAVRRQTMINLQYYSICKI